MLNPSRLLLAISTVAGGYQCHHLPALPLHTLLPQLHTAARPHATLANSRPTLAPSRVSGVGPITPWLHPQVLTDADHDILLAVYDLDLELEPQLDLPLVVCCGDDAAAVRVWPWPPALQCSGRLWLTLFYLDTVSGELGSHFPKGSSMIEIVRNYHLLYKCTEDILSVIKPTEQEKNRRLGAIQEIVNSISSVDAFRGASVKPFGSFVSNLYAKSGDLDISVDLSKPSGFPKRKKKNRILTELRNALQINGVSSDMQIIPTARVPVLKYVSNHFGIFCDISINNYPGRIKSRVLYWLNTLDGRFRDMVLLLLWSTRDGKDLGLTVASMVDFILLLSSLSCISVWLKV